MTQSMQCDSCNYLWDVPLSGCDVRQVGPLREKSLCLKLTKRFSNDRRFKTQIISSKKTVAKCALASLFVLCYFLLSQPGSLSRVAYFCAVILLQWYLLYREQRSRVLLHWFFCFVMTLNSASVLSAKWTSLTYTPAHRHTHTHADTLWQIAMST